MSTLDPNRPSALPLQACEHGIYVLDAAYDGRPGLAAIHLIVEQGRVALIDTGTCHSLPGVLQALSQLGLAPQAVDLVLLTHVHLDHAGGAGAMMQAFTQARAYVHSSGMRHMQAPSFLEQAVRAVYGAAQFERIYGRIVPIAQERLYALEDGASLTLAQRRIDVLYTPGHARHHVCFFDHASRSLFTGDTFGLSYAQLDVDGLPFILPSSSPSQFDPTLLRQSIQRLLALQPQHVYLTHYGERGRDAAQVQVLGQHVLEHIDAFVRIAHTVARAYGHPAPAPHARHAALKSALSAHLYSSMAAHGCTLTHAELERLWALDLELNAQGLGVWLDQQPTLA